MTPTTEIPYLLRFASPGSSSRTAIIDTSKLGTGEADILIKANDTDAFTVRDSVGALLTLDTSTGANVVKLLAEATTSRGVVGGTNCVVGGREYSSVAASSIITNTASETDFDTKHTLPADALRAGDTLVIEGWGQILSDNAADTVLFRCRVGGVEVFVTPGGYNASANDLFWFCAKINVRTAGAAGTFIARSEIEPPHSPSGTLTKNVTYMPSTAIDTTITQECKVTAEWSAAHADNQVQLETLTVRIE